MNQAPFANVDFLIMSLPEFAAGLTRQNIHQVPLLKVLQLTKADCPQPEIFEIVRDFLLTKWQESKQVLEKAKEMEMDLRKASVSFTFSDEKTSGTENVELGGGYVAKAVKKENYGFVKRASDDKIDKDAIDTALDKIEDTVEGGKLLAERLIKWTPELSVSEYKKLPAEAMAIIDEVIVITQGAPTLEIKEPKNKG